LSKRAITDDISCVERCSGLEQENPAFFVGYRFVLDAPRNDDEFALFDPFVTVAKFHAETAFDDEEHFVFVLVMVENEFAFEFVELYVLAVEFGGDVRLPVFGDLGEFVGDVDLVHVASDCLRAKRVAEKQ
jgi:hypothetical protein